MLEQAILVHFVIGMYCRMGQEPLTVTWLLFRVDPDFNRKFQSSFFFLIFIYLFVCTGS